MSKLQTILWLVAVVLLATAVQAQSSSGPSTSEAAVTLQGKVDTLFKSGEYDRAYLIYRNELVPLGDKYAQYMVGYMHLTGMGAVEDPVLASSWYRLAAERGTPKFIAMRDELMHGMQAEDRRRSDVEYLRLRREFSDLAILLAEVKREFRRYHDREPTTGSRVGGRSSTMFVVDTTSYDGIAMSSADYSERVGAQLEARLKLLSAVGKFANMKTDPARVDIDEIERLVSARIESIPE